ncbi:helix-turn-helix domain-containing protein [Brevundimonas sp. UBA7664]|uniref:helix-turn-helix domain-containing protein n=1 Tax=Brevundimonas sp. UBA7664 TaxID=1946141 RepID=UPI0039C86AF4
MDVPSFRKSKGWSQAELATRLRLRSKGRISTLESGADPWPTDLAIAMDRLSAGEVPVRELRPDLHDVRVVHQEAGAPA